MKEYPRLLILLFLTWAATAWGAGRTVPKAAHPFPAHNFYPGSVSPSAYSQSELDKNLYDYYRIWKKSYLVQEGKRFRVAMDKKEKTRTTSESQGYGMLITAYMAGADKEAKAIFDGLYIFSRLYPSSICKDLMSWEIPEKKPGHGDSAFDGDADIAYALLVADKQWGSDGLINYKREALRIIDAIMRCTIGKESHLPLLGDWVDPNGKKYNQYTTRSSDFMLSHFRTFYRATGDKRWLQVVDACQKATEDIQNLPGNKTALVSDFLYYDKKKKHFFPTPRHFLESQDDSYYYNACRVPWRIGADALLNRDHRSVAIVQKMLYWIWHASQKDPAKIKSGYRLDGTPIGDYFSAVFVAPFGVAAKTDAYLQEYLDALYESIKKRHENYFEDSVNLLSQLLITNNYWDPCPAPKKAK